MSDVVVRDSAIHGRGLYAARPFRKGEIVVKWNPRRLSRAEAENLAEAEQPYLEFIEGAAFLMGVPERYINHSCDPNTMPGDRCDIAKRDIATGEEITGDYADFYIPGGRMDCSCGSPKCRSIVIGKNPTP
ncbi:MAG: SET domain-containing protein-lysine N-methyltransferase [Alphaproteobacteria bacterium]|nr:SET domain-containing protein-lysine N-methyltransferase [Alphaproteobacteria bacterium]